MTLQDKLKKIILSELPALAKDIILEDNNKYIVFTDYVLEQKSGYFTVSYNNEFVGKFSSSRTALSWCVAERVKRINLSRRILELDTRKIQLDTDIDISKNTIQKSKSPEFKEIIRLKLSTKIERRDTVNSELLKCINSAKYIQITRTNNETGRTINT